MTHFTQAIAVATAPHAEAFELVQQFAAAFSEGAVAGMVGDPSRPASPTVTSEVRWSIEGEIVIDVTGSGVDLTPFDQDLMVRGVANCLDMFAIDVSGGPPPVPPVQAQYAAQLLEQRERLGCEVEEDDDWRHDESSHVVLEFRDAVTLEIIADLGRTTSVFEKLVWGMYPLPNDTYSDIGETALHHLEPNVLRYWMDGIYAWPADWKRRFEAVFVANHERLKIRAIRYVP